MKATVEDISNGFIVTQTDTTGAASSRTFCADLNSVGALLATIWPAPSAQAAAAAAAVETALTGLVAATAVSIVTPSGLASAAPSVG